MANWRHPFRIKNALFLPENGQILSLLASFSPFFPILGHFGPKNKPKYVAYLVNSDALKMKFEPILHIGAVGTSPNTIDYTVYGMYSMMIKEPTAASKIVGTLQN